MARKVSHDMPFYTLFTHFLRVTLALLLYQHLCHIKLDTVLRTCPCLFLVLPGPFFLIVFYLPFKIILALSTLKVWCLLSPVPLLSQEFLFCPPWHAVFFLIALFHNYSFMYLFLYKTEESFGIFISSYLFLYFWWLGGKKSWLNERINIIFNIKL